MPWLPTLDGLANGHDLYLKPSYGKQGRGVYRYARGGRTRDADGDEVVLRELVELVFAYRHPDGDFGYVVQRALGPHPDMMELTGIDVLATVRERAGVHPVTRRRIGGASSISLGVRRYCIRVPRRSDGMSGSRRLDGCFST